MFCGIKITCLAAFFNKLGSSVLPFMRIYETNHMNELEPDSWHQDKCFARVKRFEVHDMPVQQQLTVMLKRSCGHHNYMCPAILHWSVTYKSMPMSCYVSSMLRETLCSPCVMVILVWPAAVKVISHILTSKLLELFNQHLSLTFHQVHVFSELIYQIIIYTR